MITRPKRSSARASAPAESKPSSLQAAVSSSKASTGAAKKKEHVDTGLVKELLSDESLFGWDEPTVIAQAKNAA